MYLDFETKLSASQNPSTAGGAAASTNYHDAGAAIHGCDLPIINVNVEAITATPTLQVDVEEDSQSSFASAVVVASVKKAVVAKENLYLCIPPAAPKQFRRLKYTVTGAGADVTVSAYFGDGAQADMQKP